MALSRVHKSQKVPVSSVSSLVLGMITFYRSFNGGTNGGGGLGESTVGIPGRGSGIEISSYNLDQWELSAGQGGQQFTNGMNYYGGGGGGVLVNSQVC